MLTRIKWKLLERLYKRHDVPEKTIKVLKQLYYAGR